MLNFTHIHYSKSYFENYLVADHIKSTGLKHPEPISLVLDLDIISRSYSSKNLTVLFRFDISLYNHISSIISSCFMQLRNFRRIRPLISKTGTITSANSFIHARLDYCNSLFYGLFNYSISPFAKSSKYSCSHCH